MPYLAGAFSGVKGAEECLGRLKALLNGKTVSPYAPPPDGTGRRTLIVGEQLVANGIRQALELDYHMGGIDVATFFDADPAYMRPGDCGRMDEDELAARIRSGAYDRVIGDGLCRLFDTEPPHCRFVAVPHVAVSSRLSWESSVCPFGEHLLAYLEDGNEAMRR
jgi:hypothetical protein